MTEKAEKKAAPPPPQALVDALKRAATGNSTKEDMILIASTGALALGRARKAAGLTSKRGGFKSRVDVWLSDGKTDPHKIGSDWKSFGAAKKRVANEGIKIKLAIVPTGQKP